VDEEHDTTFPSHDLRFEGKEKEVKKKRTEEGNKEKRKGWSSGMAEASSVVYL
jgi:hypothetical protein